MTEFLVKLFVKDYEKIKDKKVRENYGILGGVVGIGCNLLLFVSKIIAGTTLKSISVTADAFNNLSDAASSTVTLVGFKLANRPADNDHPFGHGRFEYVSGFVVSFIIMMVGIEFLKNSIQKIVKPEALTFNIVSFLILIFSVFVKLWLSMFNKKIGNKIDSTAMKATAMDSLGDVLATSATIVSILVTLFTGVVIDGYIGAIVAIVVLFAGYNIAKDTLAPLIGLGVDPELAKKIHDMVIAYDGIEGVHDIIVHNYGPERSMASLHAEVPMDVNIEVSHEIIDRVERDVAKQLGIFLVIHMDPIITNDKRILFIRKSIEGIIEAIDDKLTIHDFRVVDAEENINIIFDLVVPHSYNTNQKSELEKKVIKLAKLLDSKYNCIICVESSFIME